MVPRQFWLALAIFGLVFTTAFSAPTLNKKKPSLIPGASENEIEENVIDVKEDSKVDHEMEGLVNEEDVSKLC